ncbi:MAG: ECF transporter S component [Oscillospiraceae bacterium]|nr:ECF transporter S component [Oscillospiraceae bacterium]MDD4413148.1 ECF transporter S component [Oscillospiraceae bacterium]
MNTRKLTVGGLLIAISILLPYVFHLMGFPQIGQMLLPMHLPVLLSGFILGPIFGLLLGAAAPLLNSLITNMPPVHLLPFMVPELAGYGFAAGLLFKILGNKKYGIIISLVVAMIFGRLVYAAAILVVTNLLHVSDLGLIAVVNATVKGIYGIIAQLIIIPPLIYALRKSKRFDI